MNESKLERLHKLSCRNSEQVLDSHKCGCFSCLRTFRPYSVKSWCNNSETESATALCPYCGIDAVLGDACGEEITEELLEEMNEKYFGAPYGCDIDEYLENKRLKEEVGRLIEEELTDDMVDKFFSFADDLQEGALSYEVLNEIVDEYRNELQAKRFYDLLMRVVEYCEERRDSREAVYFLKEAERLLESAERSEFLDWEDLHCSIVCRIAMHSHCSAPKCEADKAHKRAFEALCKMPVERRYTDVSRLSVAEHQSDMLLEDNHHDQALTIYNEVVNALNDERHYLHPLVARFLTLKADLFFDIDDFAQAETYYKQALDIFRKSEEKDYLLQLSLVWCCYSLGELYKEMGEDAKAIDCLNDACDNVEIIECWENDRYAVVRRLRALKILSELYVKNGKYGLALITVYRGIDFVENEENWTDECKELLESLRLFAEEIKGKLDKE